MKGCPPVLNGALGYRFCGGRLLGIKGCEGCWDGTKGVKFEEGLNSADGLNSVKETGLACYGTNGYPPAFIYAGIAIGCEIGAATWF